MPILFATYEDRQMNEINTLITIYAPIDHGLKFLLDDLSLLLPLLLQKQRETKC